MHPDYIKKIEESTARKLYNMKLHDCITEGVYEIKRVPGGWLYIETRGASTTFVPFNNEFQLK